MAASDPNETWTAWLRSATLRVLDPGADGPYYAELLGGETDGDGAVALGSGTRIELAEGEPGFESMCLDHVGEPPDGEALDPEGRRAILAGGPFERLLDDPSPRLGHLTFQSPDPLGAQAYWERLGFRLSEGLGEQFRWLRCNPIHHTLAFSRAAAPTLHHVGIELPHRSALVAACDRLSQLGQRLEYGPGRHLVGGNVFIYFLDRNGIRFELFCELERVEPYDRQPLVHAVGPRESVNLWGPLPPESFRSGI